MAQITVKYDPTIKIEEIEELMYATTLDEDPDNKEGEIAQTKVTGIVTPFIKVNHINIMWNQILYFELASVDFLPTLSFSFVDSVGFIKSLDIPGSDNLVLVQILPPFENAYKKINMRFFIDTISINRNVVSIRAIYNVSRLYQNNFKSFGKISTYDFIDKVAKDCQLGLASNIENSNDEHYIYLPNKNYVNAVKKELSISGTNDCIIDSWIDFHNYVVVCDMMERYYAIDKDLKVWTTSTVFPDVESSASVLPKEEDAILSNAIAMRQTQLYVSNYNVFGNSGNNKSYGTDKVLESYYFDDGESHSTLLQNGDVKRDTFVKSVYRGEVFGDYDYFLQETLRKSFLRKINTQYIEVYLRQPLLGLERGQRVDFRWYEADSTINAIKETKEIETNIVDDSEPDEDKESFVLNKHISGQYLIIGTKIKFKGLDKGWEYTLLLARPSDKIQNYLDNEQE